MFQSDDAPDLLRAFDRRDYLLSEAGQFEDSQARAQDEEHSARAQDEATAWRRSLSAGDTIPGEDAYDFAAMARDGVWPKPDGSGRVPLSPRYWKPGRLVVAGHDLATGRRVLSSAPLEERVLGDLPDETDADTIEQILAQAKPEDLAELSGVERNSLEAWAESHGLMLAQGGTQATQTDITNGTIGPIPRNQVQEVVGRLGSWIQRLATELDKAGISIPTPLENDPRISLKDITVGDLGKVLEDISFGFWPISGGNAATGGVGTFGLKPEALEFMNAAPAVGAAAKAATKGAKMLAPTAKEMVREGAEQLQSATGQRMDVIARRGVDSVGGRRKVVPDDVVPARSVIEIHGVRDQAKLSNIVEDMTKNGWRGDPLLVFDNGNGIFALNGSHRIAAARKTGTEIPIVKVDEDSFSDALDEAGMSFDELIGSGDDRVADFLRRSGDDRAAALMSKEAAKK